MPEISIILSLEEMSRYNLRQKNILIIDTLTAGTTIAAALANGIEFIYPFSELSSLYRFYKGKRNKSSYILIGENGTEKLAGFDYGNSPLQFLNKRFRKKSILLMTDNCLAESVKLCRPGRVYIGSLVNSSRVVEEISAGGEDICLVCAGNQGAFSLEDFFTAGRYSYLLKKAGWKGDDLCTAAGRIYECNSAYEEIVNLFCHSWKGSNLCRLGHERDIQFSSRIDILDIVPVFDGEKIREKRFTARWWQEYIYLSSSIDI
ncbi:MAG: 2-phosphosulfolactate phosphatase [Halanaerobiaceae bacterium]|nr:2-phosphosulfolactate phosphatase [Halanaerobiaceae bacterium]